MLENFILAPNLGLLGPNLGHTIFFGGFTSTRCQTCPKLQSCAISRKLFDENSTKGLKNLISLSPLPPFFFQFYLYQQLDIVPSYHPLQFKGKLINQTLENGKKTNFRPKFGPPVFLVDFTSTRCQILWQAMMVFNFKEQF